MKTIVTTDAFNSSGSVPGRKLSRRQAGDQDATKNVPRTVRGFAGIWFIAALAATSVGCTTPGDYIRNGFKVGPNCCVPQGDTAPHWIEASDIRVRSESEDVNGWWSVFNDPTLDSLIANAAAQNL